MCIHIYVHSFLRASSQQPLPNLCLGIKVKSCPYSLAYRTLDLYENISMLLGSHLREIIVDS